MSCKGFHWRPHFPRTAQYYHSVFILGTIYSGFVSSMTVGDWSRHYSLAIAELLPLADVQVFLLIYDDNCGKVIFPWVLRPVILNKF